VTIRSPEAVRRALTLFEAALDVPDTRRRTFVREQTTGDAELCAQVLRLLEADANPPPVLMSSLPGTLPGPLPSPLPEPAAGHRLGRYELRRALGRGGMGHVFLARDELLRREVAIKVFPDGLAMDERRKERLLSEARAASSIDDPHVCPVYDLGEDADGRPFIVMALCGGETLRQRLARGPLTVPEAVSIAIQVARGLRAAHDRGVVHRDVKPGNIMLTPGGVKLLDFGIADVGGARVTREGALVGTLGYMSPERASGGRGDARSDIWSLGAVLFEMVTGARPFDGEHDAATLHAILHGGVPSPGDLVTDLPTALEATIRRMLQRRAEDRYGSMADVVAALEALGAPDVPEPIAIERPGTTTGSRRGRPARAVRARRPAFVRSRSAAVGVVAAAVLVSALGLTLLTRSGPPAAAGAPEPALFVDGRVVVLPFENQTGLDDMAVVAEWAAEWVGLEITQAGVASVVPASATRAAVHRLDAAEGPVPVLARARRIAEEFGARIVISGSVFREGDRLEFHARVIDAEHGEVVRALEPVDGTVDQPSSSFPALRTRAVSAVATVTGSGFAAFTALQSQPPTYQAYQEFSRGSALFAVSEFVAAIPYFERAAALDPTYTLPLLYLNFSYGNSGRVRFEDGVIQPLDSILRIVEARRATLPLYDLNFLDFAKAVSSPNPDWEQALRAARELHRIAPGARTDYDVGANLVRLNRPREAVEFFRSLDPARGELRGWTGYWNMLTAAHHLLGDHGAEEEAARRARTVLPRSGRALSLHHRALIALDRVDEVLASVDSVLASSNLEGPVTPEHLAEEALLELWAHGHVDAARRVHQKLARRLEQRLRDGRPDPEAGEDLLFAHVIVEAWPDALAVLAPLLAERPDDPLIRGLQGVILARTGRVEEARGLGDRLAREEGIYDMGRKVTFGRGDLHPRRWAIEIAAAAGDSARAVALLREARGEGLRHGPWLHTAPGLRYIRSYPPLVALLAPAG
jgi:tetratricopeptide (TPR) repeat protein/TolB-like protein